MHINETQNFPKLHARYLCPPAIVRAEVLMPILVPRLTVSPLAVGRIIDPDYAGISLLLQY